MRDPCGIVHVWMRATSMNGSVLTTLTLDGVISPWRLKFTTYTNPPSGVTCAVAGKFHSSTRPTTSFVRASSFQR